MKFFVVSVIDGSQKFWKVFPNISFKSELQDVCANRIYDSIENIFFSIGKVRKAAGKRCGDDCCLSEFFIKSFYSGVDSSDPENIKYVKNVEIPDANTEFPEYESFIYGKSSDGKFSKKIAQIFPIRNS